MSARTSAASLDPGDVVLTPSQREARVIRVDPKLREADVERLDDKERVRFKTSHLQPRERKIP